MQSFQAHISELSPRTLWVCKASPFSANVCQPQTRDHFSQRCVPSVGETIFNLPLWAPSHRFLSLYMFELGDLQMLDPSTNLRVTWFCCHGHQLDESCWRQNNSQRVSVKFQSGLSVICFGVLSYLLLLFCCFLQCWGWNLGLTYVRQALCLKQPQPPVHTVCMCGVRV